MIDTIYHVGHLAVDRDIRDGRELTDEASKLDELASKLWRAAQAGKMILYQRRCMHGFEYHSRPIRGA